jgi:hypothetical protein
MQVHRVAKELEQVRRTARLMLIVQRFAQWIGAVLMTMLLLGLVDYALRLPGWVRLIVGVTFAVVATFWIVTRLAHAWSFAPALTTLALRAERMFPQLAGQLASGVDFLTNPERYSNPRVTGALAEASVRKLEEKLAGVSLSRLLNPALTLRYGIACVAALLIFGTVAQAAPEHMGTGLQRWLAPLGDAQWPKRTDIESRMVRDFWPADRPVRLQARVGRGYHESMRVTAHYRLLREGTAVNAWQSVLMNDQRVDAGSDATAVNVSRGDFERLVDLADQVVASERTLGANAIEFYFQAGDDATNTQTIALVDRPQVLTSELTIEPPTYANGLIETQTLRLDQQTGQIATASALQGSHVTWSMTLNKPLGNGDARSLAGVLPGFANIADARLVYAGDGSAAVRLAATFRLDATVETPLRLIDSYGLTNESDRLYRIEAVEDENVAVSMTQPSADEAVLPTAVVDLEAVAQDDVGVESVRLRLQRRSATGDGEPTELEHRTGRAARLAADHRLQLQTLNVIPGDVLELVGVAQDVYSFGGQRHDPVESAVRTLRIIDKDTLVNEIQAELVGLRQNAVRLESRQQSLLDDPAAVARAPQQELTRRVQTQQGLIDKLDARLQRNRLDDPAISNMLERAEQLLKDAQGASQEAEQSLEASRQQSAAEQAEEAAQKREDAKQAQQRVSDALSKLVNLLDQGSDARDIEAKLKGILAEQEDISKATSELMPRTLGQTLDEMSAEDRKATQDLAKRQQENATAASQAIRQMQESSNELSQSPNPEDQAAAQAMKEAAETGQREGVEQKMEEAAESLEQNRSSESSEAQQQSKQTLGKMLAQMASRQKHERDVLKRKLAELEEIIKRLVDQQKAQLDRLAQVQEVSTLELAMSQLRRNTVAAEETARASEEFAAIAAPLGDAVNAQGEAVLGLREGSREKAEPAEQAALTHLLAALDQLKRMQAQAEAEERNEERAQLKAEYEALVKRQDELRGQTGKLAGRLDLTRRERAELIEQGHRQADIQNDAGELGQKVALAVTFRHLHDQIDRVATQITQRLRAAEGDAVVLAQQRQISTMLQMMAQALDEAQEDGPFEGAADDGAQQGGQGGEGAGGGQQSTVPPLAQLKMLKAIQQDIYDRTKALDPADPSADRLRNNLATEQQELSILGENMMKTLVDPGAAPNPVERMPER